MVRRRTGRLGWSIEWVARKRTVEPRDTLNVDGLLLSIVITSSLPDPEAITPRIVLVIRQLEAAGLGLCVLQDKSAL